MANTETRVGPAGSFILEAIYPLPSRGKGAHVPHLWQASMKALPSAAPPWSDTHAENPVLTKGLTNQGISPSGVYFSHSYPQPCKSCAGT